METEDVPRMTVAEIAFAHLMCVFQNFSEDQ